MVMVKRRKERLMAAELKQPFSWFFLSFASDTAFLGGAIVQGHGDITTIARCQELGFLPAGCNVLATRIPAKDEHRVPADMRDWLLAEQEINSRLDGRRIGE